MKQHILPSLLILAFCLYIPQRAFSQAEPTLCELYCESQEFFVPCDTTAPPTDVEWNTGCVRINGVSLCPPMTCDIEICYCWRFTGYGWDYSIRAIFIRNPCEDCDPALVDLIDIAFNELFKDNPADFPCPDCDAPDPYDCPENWWREVRGLCWKEGVTPSGNKFAQVCDNPGWCFTKFCVCCDDGVPVKTIHSQQSTGSCTIEGCQVINCPVIWP